MPQNLALLAGLPASVDNTHIDVAVSDCVNYTLSVVNDFGSATDNGAASLNLVCFSSAVTSLQVQYNANSAFSERVESVGHVNDV